MSVPGIIVIPAVSPPPASVPIPIVIVERVVPAPGPAPTERIERVIPGAPGAVPIKIVIVIRGDPYRSVEYNGQR